jgi:transposase-like protein
MKTDFQRWTVKRKVELILRIMKGETTLVDICREQDLKQSEVEGWIETFLKSGGKWPENQCQG